MTKPLNKIFPPEWKKHLSPQVLELLGSRKMSKEASRLFFGFDHRKQEDVIYAMNDKGLSFRLERNVRLVFKVLGYTEFDFFFKDGRKIKAKKRQPEPFVPFHLKLQLLERRPRPK